MFDCYLLVSMLQPCLNWSFDLFDMIKLDRPYHNINLIEKILRLFKFNVHLEYQKIPYEKKEINEK